MILRGSATSELSAITMAIEMRKTLNVHTAHFLAGFFFVIAWLKMSKMIEMVMYCHLNL